ncbi:MAG: VanZ family protein [Lachnospiraceae bacterium]|nr:VanZ family protein [Lachnospiraceae bacterium]
MSPSKNRRNCRRILLGLMFLTYLVFLCYIMFFAEMLGRTEIEREYSYNLVLFREIARFIRYRDRLGMKAVFWNLGGNVLCFMPFGFFLPLISKNVDRWYLSVLLSLYLSLLIELTQLFLKVGSFDVDDLLLNTIGGLLGFLVYKLWRHICPAGE